MAAVELSEVANALLRLHFSGDSLNMGTTNPEPLAGHTLEETRAGYAELAAAGLMMLIDIAGDGQTTRYWLTLAAMERRTEWSGAAPATSPATPEQSPAPAG